MNTTKFGSIRTVWLELLCVFLLLGFFLLAMPLSADSQSRFRVNSTDPHERAAAQLQQSLGVIETKLENASVYNDPDRDQGLKWALSTFFLTYKQLSDNSTKHQIPPPDLTKVRRICKTMRNRLMPSNLTDTVARMSKEIERTEDELKVARTQRKNLAIKIKGNLALNLTAGTIEAMKSFIAVIGGGAGMGWSQIAALINVIAEKGMESIFMPSDMDPNADVSVQIQNAWLREYYTAHREEINQKMARWIHEKYFTSKWQGIPCKSMEEYVDLLRKDASKRAALKRRLFDELRLKLGNERIPFLEELLGKQLVQLTRIEKSREYKDGEVIYNKYKDICDRILRLTPWSPTGKAPGPLPKTGVIEFTHGEYSASENERKVSISVIRKGGAHGSVWVQAKTSSGSAIEWQDFDPAPDNLKWDDGEGGIKTFTVYLRDDDQLEKREYVNLTLQAPQGRVKLGTLGSARLWIEDNDDGSVSQDADLKAPGRCKLLKVEPSRVRIKPGQTINLPSVVNVIAVMEDLKERNVTRDTATYWEPGPSYTAPVSSKFNKRIHFVVHFMDCRATVRLDTEYPFWSPAISDADDVNANVPKPGPGDYKWYVLCNKKSGDVVYGKYPDPIRHHTMAGPFPGPRTAEKWIMDNCPRARCTTGGECAKGPARGGKWHVVCNKKTGAITFTKHRPGSLNFRVMAGGFRGEPEARLWQEQNCPMGRCDSSGRCARSPVAVMPSQGGWYVTCYLPTGNIEIGKKTISYSNNKVLAGPYLGEPDARLWVDQNCPSWRCDSHGRCLSEGFGEIGQDDGRSREVSSGGGFGMLGHEDGEQNSGGSDGFEMLGQTGGVGTPIKREPEPGDEFASPGSSEAHKAIEETEKARPEGERFAAEWNNMRDDLDRTLARQRAEANQFLREGLTATAKIAGDIAASNIKRKSSRKPKTPDLSYRLEPVGPNWNPVDGWGQPGQVPGGAIKCPQNRKALQEKCANVNGYIRKFESLKGQSKTWTANIQRAYLFSAQCCGYRWTTEGSGDEGGTGGGTPGTSGNAMSYDDCLKKLCPDCYKSLDLMDTSLDPQCTACKQRRAREIDDCMAGKKVGQKGGFAKEYYVILYQREWEVIKRGETPPGQHKVVYGPETWGACYDERERLYHEAASGASKKRGP